MDLANLAGHRREDQGPVSIVIRQSGDDGPNLTCDDSAQALGDACNDIPVGDCCKGGNDSNNSNQANGWTRFGVYTGNADDPCHQVIASTSSSDNPRLAGRSTGLTATGAAVKEPEDDVKVNDATVVEKRDSRRAKKRAIRASLYTYRRTNSTIYQIPVNSSLGEKYCSLATNNEKREFLAKNGAARPYPDTPRCRVAPSRKE